MQRYWVLGFNLQKSECLKEFKIQLVNFQILVEQIAIIPYYIVANVVHLVFLFYHTFSPYSQCQKYTIDDWCEPAATNALIQDEAVQTVLGMNQKHILFPCPRIFQPQNFPSYLPPPLLLPSLHFPFNLSLELVRVSELEQHRALMRHKTQGLRKVESSTLKEYGEEKARGAFQPKCKRERRKVNSFPSLHFFFSLWFFFFFFNSSA